MARGALRRAALGDDARGREAQGRARDEPRRVREGARARSRPSGSRETLVITHRALRDDLGLARPRIALAALNPHAGEEGAFGDEEPTLLADALARAARAGARAAGPFPADSVFFRAALGEFDAVVALYHDQGLIPVKLLDAVGGDPAVNVTLGLPIVRTSPDHGVAYDIAGKGVASPASMIAALRLAARIAGVRARRARRTPRRGGAPG